LANVVVDGVHHGLVQVHVADHLDDGAPQRLELDQRVQRVVGQVDHALVVGDEHALRHGVQHGGEAVLLRPQRGLSLLQLLRQAVERAPDVAQLVTAVAARARGEVSGGQRVGHLGEVARGLDQRAGEAPGEQHAHHHGHQPAGHEQRAHAAVHRLAHARDVAHLDHATICECPGEHTHGLPTGAALGPEPVSGRCVGGGRQLADAGPVRAPHALALGQAVGLGPRRPARVVVEGEAQGGALALLRLLVHDLVLQDPQREDEQRHGGERREHHAAS
jgi:hypothetical protein